MHTFSPSKMWIGGLGINKKPLLHLHTQFNRDIPWAVIDMDFLNLNQSAHGDREHGYIYARMRLPRKAAAGFWRDGEVRRRCPAGRGTFRDPACGWGIGDLAEIMGIEFVRIDKDAKPVRLRDELRRAEAYWTGR
jgi:L-arabinose isomerase